MDQFLLSFVSVETRRRYGGSLRQLLAYTDATTVDQITDHVVQVWVAQMPGANNSIRSHITATRSFLHWCSDNGHDTACNDRTFRRLLRSIPQTTGRVQAANPGRWLTHTEAFVSLLGACNDGSEIGLRDELVIRLLLSGMRRADPTTLTVGHLRALPEIAWMSKGRKQREMKLHAATVECIGQYLAAYADAMPLDDDLPLICRGDSRGGGQHHTYGRLLWGTGISDSTTVWHIVTRRGVTAGLGHIAPHDMRRSTAAILHRARSNDGGHIFSLDDIRRVLGHSSCETTQRYLDQLDTEALDRAASVLG